MIALALRWVSGNFVPALLGAGALIALGYVGWLKWTISDLEATVAADRAKQIELETELYAMRIERAATAAANAQVEAMLKEAAALDAATARSLQEVDDAPEADDGAVAPVLRRALDSLRR